MSGKRFNPWLHEFYGRYSISAEPGRPLKVAFVIGSADISGGSLVIFQHALFLQQHGVEVTIIPILGRAKPAHGWHAALRRVPFVTPDEAQREMFDLVIATWWPTVYELPRLRFRHAAYFVQSIESRFSADSPHPDAAALAELTYTFGLPVITIATWLQVFLAFEHEAPSFLVLNGIDKSVFRADGPALAPREPGSLRVLVEGSLDTAMKGVPEAIEAARAGGAAEVWLLTPSDVSRVEGADRVISRIPVQQTGEVYRSCDVLVKLSRVEGMFGPPLEMFHCGGTAVCYDVTGADEYVEDGVNGLVVPMDDGDAAAAAVRRLVRDPSLLARLGDGAAATAGRWPNWDESSARFLATVRAIAKQPPRDYLPQMARIVGTSQLHERFLHHG
jgi:glycosyltransferase involved in cell wall biosynthesis